jgi:hypothetical protein
MMKAVSTLTPFITPRGWNKKNLSRRRRCCRRDVAVAALPPLALALHHSSRHMRLLAVVNSVLQHLLLLVERTRRTRPHRAGRHGGLLAHSYGPRLVEGTCACASRPPAVLHEGTAAAATGAPRDCRPRDVSVPTAVKGRHKRVHEGVVRRRRVGVGDGGRRREEDPRRRRRGSSCRRLCRCHRLRTHLGPGSAGPRGAESEPHEPADDKHGREDADDGGEGRRGRHLGPQGRVRGRRGGG